MLFDFSLKSSFLLMFFFHGLVFAVLLFIKGKQTNNKPALWLSAFTLLCVLYISPFMLGYAGWYSQQPYRNILFYIPFQQLLVLPPLLYFYCRSLFDRSFVFTRKQLLHFLPAALYLLYSCVVVVTDQLVLGEYYFYADQRDKDFAFWYQAAGFGSLLVYLLLSLRNYRTYKQITYNTVSYADSLTFIWAQRFLLAFLLLLILRALFFIINPEWDEFGRKFWYYLSFSLLFYYISISGYVNTVRSVTSFNEPGASSANDAVENVDTAEHEPQQDAEVKTELPDIDNWKSRIEQLVLDKKLYENPELSVADIAQPLSIAPKKVSQIINRGFAVNFNDYINQHRVKAVIAKLQEGEHSLQTLLAIAYDCGFNSKSTFNRAFKRHTGLSPNAYIQKNSW
ncbi:AraC family transcriptional regulator [Lacibacter sp. H375]|uniref:helix-turn-helix domain-containing protein n=1 Tax=Lacibacter sp. H375 TaxID=3133424 RepID=UPI0030BB025A